MKRPSATEVLTEIILQNLGISSAIGIILILVSWRLFIYLSILFVAFLLGLLFQEGLVDDDGSLGLVLEHYNERFKDSKRTVFTMPMSQTVDAELDTQLEQSLNEFVGYIVRDFINGWYSNLNKSNSQEFPDAIHATLFSAFVTLGLSLSKIEPTNLILAVMKSIILHVVFHFNHRKSFGSLMEQVWTLRII